MQEKQFIEAINQLKEIKPRQEWVILAKHQLFEKAEKKPGFADIIATLIYQNQKRMAYSLATVAFAIFGMFGFAQYTMPGDLLFSVKKITEQSQSPFDIAAKRFDDLALIVKENRQQNMAPAITELQASIVGATQKIIKDQGNKVSMKEIVLEVKKLEEIKKQSAVLGVDLGFSQGEIDNIIAQLVEREIDNLKEATLTNEQKENLVEAEVLFGEQNYSGALEKILLIDN